MTRTSAQITVHISFNMEEAAILKEAAAKRELRLGTFVRSYLLRKLKEEQEREPAAQTQL